MNNVPREIKRLEQELSVGESLIVVISEIYATPGTVHNPIANPI